MFVTDVLLNWHFNAPLLGPEMIGNYLAYAGLVLLGRTFSAKASWPALLGGGLLGAIIFYLISNTSSWLFNPEYTKNLSGWIVALTRGTAGWPQTWEFFRNTLMSGGLFTGLFAGAMKIMEALEPDEEKEAAEETPEEQPEEAKAS